MKRPEDATLGEISLALENVFRKIQSNYQVLQVFIQQKLKWTKISKARNLSDAFAEKAGRRPRILIAKIGQDGHDRGAKIIATAFADIGFDVDIGPLFQTPKEAADTRENDVHIIGVFAAAGHKTLIPQLIQELKSINREDIMVVCGGVIPKQDYDFLVNAGVSSIFGPGTVIASDHIEILEKML